MSEKNNRQKIKKIQKEIDRWNKKIEKIEYQPCKGDRDLREKEESIKVLEAFVREQENKRDKVVLKAINPEKIAKDRIFKENEEISENVTWIGSKKRHSRGKDRFFLRKPMMYLLNLELIRGLKSTGCAMRMLWIARRMDFPYQCQKEKLNYSDC